MPTRINLANWYWFVGNNQGNVYSSASNSYVPPATDSGYLAWKAANYTVIITDEPTLWTSYMSVVLPAWLYNGTTFSQPAAGAYTKVQLASYSANARYNHASGGVIITSLSPVSFLSDPVSRNTMASALDYANAHTGSTVHWKMSDGTFITLNQTQLTTLVNDVAGFVQSCFTCESNTATSINAGTITTLAAIDSAYTAISNVFP
jgi:hypothetical protein